MEPPLRCTPGLELADAGERVEQHPLQLGKSDNPAVRRPLRREVAHLGQREQALVVGFSRARAWKRYTSSRAGRRVIAKFRSWERSQARRHQGMHATQEAVFVELTIGSAERVVLHRAHPQIPIPRPERNHDPPHRGG